MKNHASKFSIEKMSKIFKISRSGYYQFINAKQSTRSKEDDRLLVLIRKIYQMSRGTYGSPRIHAELRFQCETCSRKRVARLMKIAGVNPKAKKVIFIRLKQNMFILNVIKHVRKQK